MPAQEKTVLLTQSAYDKLKKEQEWREGPEREHIVTMIGVARAEGDLSENGGYQAAREAQSKNEGRINELIVVLRNAKILEPPPAGTVGVGSVVTFTLGGNEMTYALLSSENADATTYDVISPDSPIGLAINGSKVGDSVTYETPTGNHLTVEIKEAQPLTEE